MTLKEIYDLDQQVRDLEGDLAVSRTEALLAWETREDVVALREEIERLTADRDRLLQQARSEGIMAEGSYVLKVATRKIRTVIPALFAEKFGFDLFCRVATVPVGAAEKVVGKEALTECCSIEEKEIGATVELVTERTEALRKKKGWK